MRTPDFIGPDGCERRTGRRIRSLFEQQYKISLAAVRQLQLAMAEARKMNAKVIGSEHILLALIHDKRAMDSEILRQIKEEYLNFDISIQAIGGFDMPPQMVRDSSLMMRRMTVSRLVSRGIPVKNRHVPLKKVVVKRQKVIHRLSINSAMI